MSKISFRRATVKDAEYVGKHLRKADCEEVMALGFTPEHAVKCSFNQSDICYTGLIDGEPSMIFGVVEPLLFDPAAIWALGTDKCTAHPRDMLVHGRKWVRKFVEKYGYLENYCDARYVPALRWLRRIGFTVGDPEPHGINKAMFCKLSIKKEN